MKIQCTNDLTSCQEQAFTVTMSYNTIVASPVHGTDHIDMKTREHIESTNAFRVDMYLRPVLVTEFDKLSLENEVENNLALRKPPNIITAKIP